MELNVDVVKFEKLSAASLDLWLEIVTRNEKLASPYFHPMFAESCTRAKRNVHVSIIESDMGMAFFPFELISGRRAGPLGSIMGDFHGIISDDSKSLDLADLIRLSGLSRYSFDHLLCDDVIPLNSTSAISPVIEIGYGYNVYRERKIQQKSKLFKKIEKYKVSLETELGPLRFEHCTDDEKLLQSIIKLKSEQYRRSGIIDLFSFQWPISLLSNLLTVNEKGFRGCLSCLYAGNHAVFLHFGMQTTRRFHYWFPVYPTEYSRFSPGIVGLDFLIRSVAEERLTAIDLGKGDNLYKSRFANAETVLFEGEIVASALESLKVSVLDKLSKTVKQSPFLYRALSPLRWATRHYRHSRRFR